MIIGQDFLAIQYASNKYSRRDILWRKNLFAVGALFILLTETFLLQLLCTQKNISRTAREGGDDNRGINK